VSTAPRAAGRSGRPDLRHERSLLRAGAGVVAGMDEVGRGALAGPVSVGVVAVDLGTRACPPGVADSKLLRPAARTALLGPLGRWGRARAVGHASPAEIDAVGIVAALRLAGCRALASLDLRVDVVLLDGSHDWLSCPAADLLDGLRGLGGPDGRDDGSELAGAGGLVAWASLGAPRVVTRVKADRTCSSVAAARVLAKCERDALMVDLAPTHPAYRWDENKGYGAPEHLAALRDLGTTQHHRRSWRLPDRGPQAGGTVPSASAVDLLGTDDPRAWSMMDA